MSSHASSIFGVSSSASSWPSSSSWAAYAEPLKGLGTLTFLPPSVLVTIGQASGSASRFADWVVYSSAELMSWSGCAHSMRMHEILLMILPCVSPAALSPA